MIDEQTLDEKLAPQRFVDDFVWAARALRAQPSVAMVSAALWVVPVVVSWARTVNPYFVLAWLVITPIYFGWFGAERLFFLRQREEKKTTLRELVVAARLYAGRFFRLGVLVSLGLIPVWLIFIATLQYHSPTHSSLGTSQRIMTIASIVLIDLVLTFVPSALVFTTRSTREALRIGWSMIRETWPRSGLYVLCPPLALNVLSTIYPTHTQALQIAKMVGVSLLALVAKGATAAFYLRERSASLDLPSSPAP
ncbi:MAG TPA: hypothetical protein VH560_09735 [Polyangia bacterium]|jgi:hypothetical protein|nr:hypothetical protein [Polyangia bacterium]